MNLSQHDESPDAVCDVNVHATSVNEYGPVSLKRVIQKVNKELPIPDGEIAYILRPHTENLEDSIATLPNYSINALSVAHLNAFLSYPVAIRLSNHTMSVAEDVVFKSLLPYSWLTRVYVGEQNLTVEQGVTYRGMLGQYPWLLKVHRGIENLTVEESHIFGGLWGRNRWLLNLKNVGEQNLTVEQGVVYRGMLVSHSWLSRVHLGPQNLSKEELKTFDGLQNQNPWLSKLKNVGEQNLTVEQRAVYSGVLGQYPWLSRVHLGPQNLSTDELRIFNRLQKQYHWLSKLKINEENLSAGERVVFKSLLHNKWLMDSIRWANKIFGPGIAQLKLLEAMTCHTLHLKNNAVFRYTKIDTDTMRFLTLPSFQKMCVPLGVQKSSSPGITLKVGKEPYPFERKRPKQAKYSVRVKGEGVGAIPVCSSFRAHTIIKSYIVKPYTGARKIFHYPQIETLGDEMALHLAVAFETLDTKRPTSTLSEQARSLHMGDSIFERRKPRNFHGRSAWKDKLNALSARAKNWGVTLEEYTPKYFRRTRGGEWVLNIQTMGQTPPRLMTIFDYSDDRFLRFLKTGTNQILVEKFRPSTHETKGVRVDGVDGALGKLVDVPGKFAPGFGKTVVTRGSMGEVTETKQVPAFDNGDVHGLVYERDRSIHEVKLNPDGTPKVVRNTKLHPVKFNEIRIRNRIYDEKDFLQWGPTEDTVPEPGTYITMGELIALKRDKVTSSRRKRQWSRSIKKTVLGVGERSTNRWDATFAMRHKGYGWYWDTIVEMAIDMLLNHAQDRHASQHLNQPPYSMIKDVVHAWRRDGVLGKDWAQREEVEHARDMVGLNGRLEIAQERGTVSALLANMFDYYRDLEEKKHDDLLQKWQEYIGDDEGIFSDIMPKFELENLPQNIVDEIEKREDDIREHIKTVYKPPDGGRIVLARNPKRRGRKRRKKKKKKKKKKKRKRGRGRKKDDEMNLEVRMQGSSGVIVDSEDIKNLRAVFYNDRFKQLQEDVGEQIIELTRTQRAITEEEEQHRSRLKWWNEFVTGIQDYIRGFVTVNTTSRGNMGLYQFITDIIPHTLSMADMLELQGAGTPFTRDQRCRPHKHSIRYVKNAFNKLQKNEVFVM